MKKTGGDNPNRGCKLIYLAKSTVLGKENRNIKKSSRHYSKK